MANIQDVCISELLGKGIIELHHNQTICRLADEGYQLLLKCLVLSNPAVGVDYCDCHDEYPTLALVFSKIGSDDILDKLYLHTVPQTVKEIESLMKRTLAVKIVTKG